MLPFPSTVFCTVDKIEPVPGSYCTVGDAEVRVLTLSQPSTHWFSFLSLVPSRLRGKPRALNRLDKSCLVGLIDWIKYCVMK